MSLFPHSHKTVFVLDHGPYFAMPCQTVEYDVGRRAGPGFIPLKPIKKLVWTSAVEAVAGAAEVRQFLRRHRWICDASGGARKVLRFKRS